MNPMTARVRLRDVIEAIDLPNQNWQSYLDPDTGEIVTLTDEGRELVRKAELRHDTPGEQREELPSLEALELDRFLALPGSFEIHEWSIMEQFARSRDGAAQQDELVESLHGPGAFRLFRSTVRRLGIEDEWYRFRDAAFEGIAKDWLEANGIGFE